MVRFGDFEVQLVDAHHIQPFPEHTKDGKQYVEVKVGAEYYVAVRRVTVDAGSKFKMLDCYVDGQYLGTSLIWPNPGQEVCFGVRSSSRTLKVVHPTHDPTLSYVGAPDMCGTIRLVVHEESARGSTGVQPQFKAPSMTMNLSGNKILENKIVRTTSGSQKRMPDLCSSYYVVGAPELATYTLHYGTRGGLLAEEVSIPPVNVAGTTPPSNPWLLRRLVCDMTQEDKKCKRVKTER